jgi:tetratricopeptide (TPR) repeat protein/transcriptional regulator with XRE-family HTH domain
MRQDLPELLLWERKRRHWTRKDVAENLGVAEVSIYRWETGRVTPRSDELRAILALYGITPNDDAEDSSGVWMVPFLKNRYFTGREPVLDRLRKALTESSAVAVISQTRRTSDARSRALSGLGGVGKTQTAVEYAHRYHRAYDLVLWARGDSYETLMAEFAALATRLGLPDRGETNQLRLALAVKEHLETRERRGWLLIVDNVDDLATLKEFLPTRAAQRNGAVLVTTRQHAVGSYMTRIEVDTFTEEESFEFLLRRAGEARDLELDALPASERQAATALFALMDGLPLALDQAAAFIEETGCSLADYVALYRERRDELLRLGNAVDAREYPDSVATTWLMSFQRVVAHPTAADLLRLCAFLYPDAIPEEVFLSGAAALGPHLQLAATEPTRARDAVDLLLNYSLVQYQAKTRTLSMHRLVQAVIQDTMGEAERRDWAERVALAVNAVYPSLADQSDWPQCERLLPHALLACHTIETQDIESEEAARLLHETASYLQDRARYAEAEPLFQRALQIREKWLGPEHLDVAASLNGLADLRREQGKLAEAEPDFQRALQITEERLGPEHVLVARSLANLANLYHARGQHKDAEPLYERGRRLYERHIEEERRAGRVLPRTQMISYARLLSDMAATIMESGRYAEAESLLHQAIATLEREVGPEHLDLAGPINNLAILLKEQGAYARAEPLYQRARHVWELHLEPDHPQLALAFNNLAELYKEQGRYAEAGPLYQRALDNWEKRLGSDHPMVAIARHNLADVAYAERRYAEAEALYQRALAAFESSVGAENYLTAYALNGLANVYRERGRYAEAEELYQRALHVRQTVWDDPSHPETAETMYDLARLREAQDDREAARDWYMRALAAREASLGVQHPKTVETRQRLAALLQAMGRDDEAASYEVP